MSGNWTVIRCHVFLRAEEKCTSCIWCRVFDVVYFSELRTWRVRPCECAQARGPCFPGSCCCFPCLTQWMRRRPQAAGRASFLLCCWSVWAEWRFLSTPSIGKPESSRTEKISSGQTTSTHCQNSCVFFNLRKMFYSYFFVSLLWNISS